MSSARWRRGRRRAGRDEGPAKRPRLLRIDVDLRRGARDPLEGMTPREQAIALKAASGARYATVVVDESADPITIVVCADHGICELVMRRRDYSAEVLALEMERLAQAWPAGGAVH